MALGDLFNNGQYRVIRKLGEGSYSTVWLALDVRYVASIELEKIYHQYWCADCPKGRASMLR